MKKLLQSKRFLFGYALAATVLTLALLGALLWRHYQDTHFVVDRTYTVYSASDDMPHTIQLDGTIVISGNQELDTVRFYGTCIVDGVSLKAKDGATLDGRVFRGGYTESVPAYGLIVMQGNPALETLFPGACAYSQSCFIWLDNSLEFMAIQYGGFGLPDLPSGFYIWNDIAHILPTSNNMWETA